MTHKNADLVTLTTGKITCTCATWRTRITGVTKFSHLVNIGFFQIPLSRSSYPTICSLSRSPRMDGISTSSSSTSPPVLPLVELCAWVRSAAYGGGTQISAIVVVAWRYSCRGRHRKCFCGVQSCGRQCIVRLHPHSNQCMVYM